MLLRVHVYAGIAAIALLLACGDSNSSGSTGPSNSERFDELSSDEQQDLCETFLNRFDNYAAPCEAASHGDIDCAEFTSEVSSCTTGVTVGEIRTCGSTLTRLSCEEEDAADEESCASLNSCLDGRLSNSSSCPDGYVRASGPSIDDGCFKLCSSDRDCNDGESCTPTSDENVNLCIGS